MDKETEQAEMRSYKDLFEKITSFDNLLLASRKAQKGKRFKSEVLNFNYILEKELFDLQNELISGSYTPGSYYTFYINDPKHREISAAPYRDRVVHHAICNIIAPLWDKGMIYDSYACRKDKGTHKAICRFTEYARKNKYVLKCDIKKFFKSIDHDILKNILSGRIKERKTRELLYKIIDSSNAENGLPIGNLTSQWFANIYLNEFDHFVKEVLNCKYYIRYMDDIVFFLDSKKALNKILLNIKDCLAGLNLKLKENHCHVWQTALGVNYLGFKVFPTHRILLKRNVHRVKRRLRYFQRKYAEGIIDLDVILRSINSWLGHVSWGDTYNLRKSLFDRFVFRRD